MLKPPIPHPDFADAVIFEADDPSNDVYIRITSNNWFYPVRRAAEASVEEIGKEWPTLDSKHELIGRHPILDEVISLGGMPPLGWWTQSLQSICAKLGLNHDWIAPCFPAETKRTAREILQLANEHFEAHQHSPLSDFAEAQDFGKHILLYLANEREAELDKAEEVFNSIASAGRVGQIRFCFSLNDVLMRNGYRRGLKFMLGQRNRLPGGKN